jgi:hypothetical protein
LELMILDLYSFCFNDFELSGLLFIRTNYAAHSPLAVLAVNFTSLP